MTTPLTEETAKQLSIYFTELYQAITALTVAVNALYEQQRVRTWEQGLGMPATVYVPEPGRGPPEKPAAPPASAPGSATLNAGYEPVKAAILAYAGKHGQKAAQDILARFNAKSGLQLKPDQYRQVLEAFK